MKHLFFIVLLLSLFGCQTVPDYDLVIRGGTIYDGSGTAPYVADVAINQDTIVLLGDLSGVHGATELDATGLAVAPGFINMLSWATESLIVDGRSMSDIRQGVTLEIFGEGVSMGPLNENMKADAFDSITHMAGTKEAAEALLGGKQVPWTTLEEYLEFLVHKGVSPNVASFVGATTVRIHEIGEADRAPTSEELTRMQGLVRQAMEGGALGVGSSLIYAPAFFAKNR